VNVGYGIVSREGVRESAARETITYLRYVGNYKTHPARGQSPENSAAADKIPAATGILT